MSSHTCPWWIGYLLVSPLRRWFENPRALLGPYVWEGMRVLEPGPGMGFFTLELARMVGSRGGVVAVDVQPRMIAALRRRARRAGLGDRIEARCVEAGQLGVDDLAGTFDLAVLVHMLHEVSDPPGFLRAVHTALKPGGVVLLVEPRGHVSAEDFAASLSLATGLGFAVVEPAPEGRLRALLRRG